MTVAAHRRDAHVEQPGSRRTLQALLATGLGIMPLCQMFTDLGWLVDAWITISVVLVPAALLRLRWRPHPLQVWLGLLLATGWITGRFLASHAVAGVLPGPGAWRDASELMQQLHDTVANGVAPVHTTAAIRFTLCALLALLSALVDLVAVVGRHGALAGIPLLLVYTVSGAVPRQPVSWVLFLAAAAGFLLLLGLDANDDLRTWGRLMPRAGVSRPVTSLAVSGQRIAVIAVVAALVLPLLAPSRPTNLIAEALHNNSGSGVGNGDFGADGVQLNPFAALRGDLVAGKPVNLFTVTLDSLPARQPFYLRANVLTTYTDAGWSTDGHGNTVALGDQTFPTLPDTAAVLPSTDFTARIRISGLGGNPPVFGLPAAVSGLPDTAGWSPQDQILLGMRVRNGLEYTEVVRQPNPSAAELDTVAPVDLSGLQPWLQVPRALPPMVTALVARLVGNTASPYQRTMDIYRYLTDPAQGFTYSLRTKAGDSGSDLVDFLTNKAGYCQQYAAAMGIMLRVAGVPSRVVLGYTHPAPDASNTFTVSTNNAHAWVEAYFAGLGWVPFDPTPLAGIAGGAQSVLPYAPRQAGVPSGSQNTSDPLRPNPKATQAGGAPAPGQPAAPPPRRALDALPLVGIAAAVLVVLAVLLLPAAVRWTRRRRRLNAARAGDPDPLWAELSATVVDLGYVWSPARSPRQVVDWLGRDAAADTALASLATAVETARYAPESSPLSDRDAAGQPPLVGELHSVEAQLRARRSTGARLRARLLPASLGWRWLPRSRRR